MLAIPALAPLFIFRKGSDLRLTTETFVSHHKRHSKHARSRDLACACDGPSACRPEDPHADTKAGCCMPPGFPYRPDLPLPAGGFKKPMAWAPQMSLLGQNHQSRSEVARAPMPLLGRLQSPVQVGGLAGGRLVSATVAAAAAAGACALSPALGAGEPARGRPGGPRAGRPACTPGCGSGFGAQGMHIRIGINS